MYKKRVFFLMNILLFTTVIGCKGERKKMKSGKQFTHPVSFAAAGEWADSIVSLMTLKEKISMIGGDSIFFTTAVPRLNIPSVMMSDASAGVHIRDSFHEYVYKKVLAKSTAFPTPIMLASTWDTALAANYAHAIGEECRAGGIAVLLGPGMNIYRNSQCGRNCEYLGEDPFLAAAMVTHYVRGLQSTGTIATLKHFIANNSDFFRRKSNSVVGERALHEIYLPAFKAGIDAGAMAVMTSYNLLNGEWCGQSHHVIHDLLRKDLGFKGLVMTDWWSTYDGIKLIRSGQDLEMPYRVATENAEELVKEGKVAEANIDSMVVNTLRTLYYMNAFDRKPDPSYLSKYSEHVKIALQTAREGAVLLRNKNNILPLQDPTKKILLTGQYLHEIPHEGGSATVEGYDQVTLATAMKENFGDNLQIIDSADDAAIRSANVVVLSIGTFDSEGWDHSFDLPEETEKRVEHVAALNPNTVVVVNSGSGINMSHWNGKVAAILYGWYPGQVGMQAIAEILSGKINPSGKLPITIEKSFKDSPAYGYIPKGEELYTGWNDEVEKTKPVFDVVYKEGVFVGYRWYETKKIAPLYPFGYGLSYTHFDYSDIKVSKPRFTAEDTIAVTFTVKNTGKRQGAEIAQLYISDNKSSIPRPVKELKGFDRVNLKPGESKRITISLSRLNFSFWSPEEKDWVAEPGDFEILVGGSSQNIALKAKVELL